MDSPGAALPPWPLQEEERDKTRSDTDVSVEGHGQSY
jgi:hypothetical protein